MRIRWTEAAARDLTGICDYIKERDSPAAARRVAVQIYGAVGTLTKFAHRGRPGRKPGTRELVFPGLPFLAVTSAPHALRRLRALLPDCTEQDCGVCRSRCLCNAGLR